MLVEPKKFDVLAISKNSNTTWIVVTGFLDPLFQEYCGILHYITKLITIKRKCGDLKID